MTQSDDSPDQPPTPEEVLAVFAEKISEAHATGDTGTLVSLIPPLINILLRQNGPTPYGWLMIAVPFGHSEPEDLKFSSNVSKEGVYQLIELAHKMAPALSPVGGEGGNAPRH